MSHMPRVIITLGFQICFFLSLFFFPLEYTFLSKLFLRQITLFYPNLSSQLHLSLTIEMH